MLAELSAELPDGTVVTDPDILASYRQDRASDPNAGTPLAVVRPLRTEEVQTVMRWATKHHVAVVPRGAGTGLSGGATALDGGIVLSTERMRDIAVDPVTRTAVTQPGLFNAEVKKAVAEYGLWYPPAPPSFEVDDGLQRDVGFEIAVAAVDGHHLGDGDVRRERGVGGGGREDELALLDVRL